MSRVRRRRKKGRRSPVDARYVTTGEVDVLALLTAELGVARVTRDRQREDALLELQGEVMAARNGLPVTTLAETVLWASSLPAAEHIRITELLMRAFPLDWKAA